MDDATRRVLELLEVRLSQIAGTLDYLRRTLPQVACPLAPPLPIHQEGALLSPQEVCERLGIKMTTFYKFLADGSLESCKVGTRRRVPVRALEAFLAERRAQAEARYG